MAKPNQAVTPPGRVDRWKKMWGTPRLLEEAETEAAFEEFQEALVPSRMHKMFLKQFGVAQKQFGNRFFGEEAVFHNWDTRLSSLFGPEVTHAEATVIYGSPDKLEAHTMRGEVRRSLRDVIIDDWQTACAIVRTPKTTLYIFVEPKMRGVIVRAVQLEQD